MAHNWKAHLCTFRLSSAKSLPKDYQSGNRTRHLYLAGNGKLSKHVTPSPIFILVLTVSKHNIINSFFERRDRAYTDKKENKFFSHI